MPKSKPFIIDTDLNFPSDDLQALLLLICASGDRLKGVSVCAGNTFSEESFINVREALRLFGLGRMPMAHGAPWQGFEGRRELVLSELKAGLVPFAGSYQKGARPRKLSPFNVSSPLEGLQFPSLLDLIEAQEQPVDIVCLGPLTNLADAIVKRPSITQKIDSVWFMGSNIHVDPDRPKMDFNVWYDPISAKTVLESDIEIHILPYEVCRQHRSDEDLLARVGQYREGITHLFAVDFAGMARQHGVQMPLCDQLLGLCYAHPELVSERQRVEVHVDLTPGRLFGSSRMERSTRRNLHVVKKVNFPAWRACLFRTLDKMQDMKAHLPLADFLESDIYTADTSKVRLPSAD